MPRNGNHRARTLASECSRGFRCRQFSSRRFALSRNRQAVCLVLNLCFREENKYISAIFVSIHQTDSYHLSPCARAHHIRETEPQNTTADCSFQFGRSEEKNALQSETANSKKCFLSAFSAEKKDFFRNGKHHLKAVSIADCRNCIDFF